MTRVEHEPDGGRFLVRLDAGEAELEYIEREGRVLDLIHTFVPPEERGQGIGAALVEHAFGYAREEGYRVRASCPFVRRWVEDHPEQAGLLEAAA